MRAINSAICAVKNSILRMILRSLRHGQPDHLPFLSVDTICQVSGPSVDFPKAFLVSLQWSMNGSCTNAQENAFPLLLG